MEAGAAGKGGGTAKSLTQRQSVVFSLHVCLYLILTVEVSPSDSASKGTFAAAPCHRNHTISCVERWLKS